MAKARLLRTTPCAKAEVLRQATAPQAFSDPSSLPEVFTMRLVGTCMEPELYEGDSILVDKRHNVKDGDLAVLFFCADRIAAGQANPILKRVVLALPPFVRLPYRNHPNSKVRAIIAVEALNPRQQWVIDVEHLLALYWASPLPPGAKFNAKAKAWSLPPNVGG